PGRQATIGPWRACCGCRPVGSPDRSGAGLLATVVAVRWLVVAAAVLLASCGGEGDVASTTAATANATAATTLAPDAIVPHGFQQVAATATKADGTVCQLCLWLAGTGDQRELGLMYV